MPKVTDARIEELCAPIRVLCRGPFSPQAELELRKLARKLRVAIGQHVSLARSSLTAKKSAIALRDLDAKQGIVDAVPPQ